MKHTLKISTGLYALLAPCLAFSLDIKQPRVDEEIIVTATLTEKSIFEVTGGAAVITAEDILRIQPANLSDLLDQQTSLDITRNGGKLSTTSLFSRGTSSDHTLILINGQRFNSETLGGNAFQVIDPEQISRIEILRGSRSALYGSDAIGGVIQIFTNKKHDGTSGFLTMEEGSDDLQRLSVGGGYGDKQLSVSASLSYEESSDIDNLVDDTGFNSDKDPYKLANSNLFVVYDYSDTLSLSFSDINALSENDYDSRYSPNTSQPYSKGRVRTTAFDIDIKASDRLDSKVSFGRSLDESSQGDRQDPDSGTSTIETQRKSMQWLNSLTFSKAVVGTVGVEYIDINVDSESGYPVDDRNVQSGFGQIQWNVAMFDFLIGVRNDEYSDYGGTLTGSFSSGLAISEHYRIYANWNEGFKAPTFNDLFWPEVGNRDLLPETSVSRELGFKAQYEHIFFELNTYKSEIENMIDWAPDSDGIWRPTNIDDADIQGSEVSAKIQFDSWYIESSFTYLDARDANTDMQLEARANRTYAFDFNKTLAKLNLGALVKLQSERAVSFGDPIPGYGTLGIYFSYALIKDLALRVKLDNVLDKDYQLDTLYNTNGRSGSMKLTYSF